MGEAYFDNQLQALVWSIIEYMYNVCQKFSFLSPKLLHFLLDAFN